MRRSVPCSISLVALLAWHGAGEVPNFPIATVCSAAEDVSDVRTDAGRARLHAELDAEILRLTAEIDKSPNSVDLYSRRGDQLFFRGEFAKSVADFEKMVELQPDQETSHWRRGIAYFYAEQFPKAAHQFEIYHSFDNVDRENGIWRYLSQVKAIGREAARKGLLKYEKDDREPFPDVYRLFAGELTGDEVLARIKLAKIAPGERDKRLFYAELYVGLNDFVEERLESAERHLGEAVGNRWGKAAGGGPGWMWHVGRVHFDLLRAERETREKPDGARGKHRRAGKPHQ
ncbi:MAG: tetratricopeptide repeat protein [Planctomycetales bacterium]